MHELIKEIYKQEFAWDPKAKKYDVKSGFNRFIKRQQMIHRGKYTAEEVYDAIMDATLWLYEKWLAKPDMQVSWKSITYKANNTLLRQKRHQSGYLQDGNKPKHAGRATIYADYNRDGQPLVDSIGKDYKGDIVVSSDYAVE